MNSIVTRGRLLSGSAFVVASAVGLAAPAQAQCVVTATTVTCATTATVNTTNTGTVTTTATDREYVVDTTTAGATVTVSADAVVSGNGLAVTAAPGGGANTLTVANNGSITVIAGNTPTAGGTGALSVTGTGATNLVYTGAGDITNLGAGDGLEFNLTGTGSLDTTVGGSIAATAGDAIRATSTDAAGGTISITTTAGETLAASGGDGIDIDTAGSGDVTVVNAADITGGAGLLQDGINVTSTGTGSISIDNSGAIGATGAEAQLTGITALVNNAASNGSITVTGDGAINSLGIGINAETLGGGDITIDYDGDIASDGLRSISALGTTGAVSITTGGTITNTADGRAGIFGVTTTGDLDITVNGDITASGVATAGINAISDTGAQTIVINADVTGETALISDSDGTRTITVGTAGTLDGVNEAIAINGTGAATIANSGRIGSDTTDVAVRVNADADTTINNLTGGTVNGSILLGAGDDTVTNAGTINAGTMDFGAGTDLLTNQAGGTITVAGTTPITGLETLNNAGTITAATGLTFDAGDTVFNNTGTLNVAGAIDLGEGTDTFTNSGAGVLNLSGDASIIGAETVTNTGRTNLNAFALTGTGAFTNTGFLDTSGNASLLGFTSFSNSGTLDLAAGTFTVPAEVFTNTGIILADEGAATITGQTSFANSGTIDLQDGATGDVLTINSAFVGSGSSNLLVDVDATTADRLVIVGDASGSTTINASYLNSGLIDLGGVLVVDATTATAGAFTLGTVGGNTSPLVNYSLVQNGGDFLLVATPDQAAFDPLALTGFGRGLWYQSADEVIAQTRLPAATIGGSFWGHVYLSRDRYDDDSTQTLDGVDFDIDRNLRTKRRGIQIGADYGFEGGRVGVTGGYARARTDTRGGDELGLKARGWNVGVYGQFGGITGFHGEVLAKHDRHKIDFNAGAFDGSDTKARANGIDGAIGFRFPLGEEATLDANAGVSFVRTKFDDIDAFGFGYDLDTVKSTRGRAGLRAVFGGAMSPYIDGTVYREFRGDGRVALFDGSSIYDLETEGRATWFRVEGGILPNPTGLMLAAWADLGDKKGIGARLGFRFGGAPVAVAPPPPPPVATVAPPPPPPATQTCPDGSVILATDSCPLPPPPPPPPPPAPERG